MNDRILADPPPRAADGHAQGCAWCVVLGWLALVAAGAAIMMGVG